MIISRHIIINTSFQSTFTYFVSFMSKILNKCLGSKNETDYKLPHHKFDILFSIALNKNFKFKITKVNNHSNLTNNYTQINDLTIYYKLLQNMLHLQQI